MRKHLTFHFPFTTSLTFQNFIITFADNSNNHNDNNDDDNNDDDNNNNVNIDIKNNNNIKEK